MTVDARDDSFFDLVDETARLECLASGFSFIEGPVWDAATGSLLFSDVRGNERYVWDGAAARRVAAPTFHGNGMTMDARHRLLVCEHDTSAVVRMDPDGSGAGREIVVDSYDGRALNSPNDVVVASDESIYFTDPPYGRLSDSAGVRRPLELDFHGVFRVTDAGVEVVADDFERPNGLCLAPDESVLYVNDSARGHIRVFEVPSWRERRVFAEGIRDDTGVVDGMKCDARGNVWVTGPGGVWVLDPLGAVLGVVRVPEHVGNLHWGGPAWSSLYIAASTSLYRLAVNVSGRLEPFMAPG